VGILILNLNHHNHEQRNTDLSSTDDISQGIGIVDISDNNGISEAVACDMSSREEDTTFEEKSTSCDQKLDNVKTNDVEVDNTSGGVNSNSLSGDISCGGAKVSICANCGKEGASNTCNK